MNVINYFIIEAKPFTYKVLHLSININAYLFVSIFLYIFKAEYKNCISSQCIFKNLDDELKKKILIELEKLLMTNGRNLYDFKSLLYPILESGFA